MRKKVAIQGIEGSFHHQAAQELLGDTFEIVPCETFSQVFASVISGKTEYAVTAVENSLYGSINAVYRLLANKKIWVQGEVYLNIEQYLIGARNLPLSSITSVLSQAPALSQCETWLEKKLPRASLVETHDTATSVRDVVERPSEPLAAVAGKHAADLYGGTIIAGPINDDPHNYTRFFLLSKHVLAPLSANKTSIILTTDHKPGALQRALSIFNDAGVNLSKVDSHPISGDRWHYAFYIDFELGVASELGREIIEKLEAQNCKVTVLGSYIAGELPRAT